MKKALAVVLTLILVFTLIPLAEAEQNEILINSRLGNSAACDNSEDVYIYPSRDLIIDYSLLKESFEPSSSLDGWWTYDADQDGENWHWSKNQHNHAYDGSGFMFSYSYLNSTAIDCDNWLVTPNLTILSPGFYFSMYARSNTVSYLDHFQVLVGVKGVAYTEDTIYPDAWITVIPSTLAPDEYAQFTYDLSAFAGNTIAIAIRHKDCNKLALMIDYVQVGVSADVVNETGIRLNTKSLQLPISDSAQLYATIEPENASFDDVTWSSSDTSVAVVNKYGGVLAMGKGFATITATSHNGHTAFCTVLVYNGGRGYETDSMMTFGIYDLDGENERHAWYRIDEYGMAEVVLSVNYELLYPIWHPVDSVIYAYRINSNNLYDFVSVDPTRNYAVTRISANVKAPSWMTYDFDKNLVYGGFMELDEDYSISAFEIATIDLSNGRKDSVLIDLYNQAFKSQTPDHTYCFLPMSCTYAGDGVFIGADYQYNDLLWYAPNYHGQGFAWGSLNDEIELHHEIGNVTSYIQGMYYNPFDEMLYWNYVSSESAMVVADLRTGIACKTGICGPYGAEKGVETSGIFAVYTLPPAYTVSFYDSLTGEVLAVENVWEGHQAKAPEVPEHKDYVFIGWDNDFSCVTSDLVVYAMFDLEFIALIGDVNCDGDVSFSDITLLSQYLSGKAFLTSAGVINADMLHDEDISFADVGAIYYYLIN